MYFIEINFQIMSFKLKCHQCSGVISDGYLDFGNILQKHEYYPLAAGI